jgi:hypothetical protein
MAQVRRNKGAPGVDGMTVDDLAPYLRDHRPDGPIRLRSSRRQGAGGARDQDPAARGHLPTAAGVAGRDPQGWRGRRHTWPRHPDGARPLHPAGGAAGAAASLGPDVLRRELWLSARPIRPSGGRPSPSLYRRRARLRGRSRPGEILRPGRPGPPDGAGGEAGRRPAPSPAHPRLSERGRAGGRAGRANGRRRATGWPTLAPVVQPDARRAGSRAGPTWPSVRALCRRLQHPRAQSSGRRAGHGERRRRSRRGRP